MYLKLVSDGTEKGTKILAGNQEVLNVQNVSFSVSTENTAKLTLTMLVPQVDVKIGDFKFGYYFDGITPRARIELIHDGEKIQNIKTAEINVGLHGIQASLKTVGDNELVYSSTWKAPVKSNVIVEHFETEVGKQARLDREQAEQDLIKKRQQIYLRLTPEEIDAVRNVDLVDLYLIKKEEGQN